MVLNSSDSSLSRLPHFDPRHVPVEGVDSHLPAVTLESLQPAALRQRFAHPPVWEPELLTEKRFSDRTPMPASVLIPIVMREQPTVLLTERTIHLSTHSGQIAFPGGKFQQRNNRRDNECRAGHIAVSYTHLTLPTNREV